MHIIGITGGIGSGKSKILEFLREKEGFLVYEADLVAHRLMEPGTACYEEIVRAFGEEILKQGNGSPIDREALGSLCFRDPEALGRLNGIVHPAVRRFFTEDIELKRREHRVRFYVIEAALLIQDGYQTICDEIWTVEAPEETRIKRLMEYRGYKREKALSVLSVQPEPAFYRAHSHRVIENDGDFEKTAALVNANLNKFTKDDIIL